MHTNASVHLQLENRVSDIAPLLDRIEAFLGDNGVPPEIAFRFHLALDELLTNTLTYGFPAGGPNVVSIDIAVNEDVHVTLSDDGIAFDPLQAPVPDIDAPLEDRPVGGLGVHLVRQLIPKLSYRREGGRNVIELGCPLAADALVAGEGLEPPTPGL